ncbi:MAG: dihydroorotate dehydrogenase electron transfer subunit [Bacillota bacterium]|nr:dihydroorotate dehydrogenase electron transfer subunit [Bacillota bacterium]
MERGPSDAAASASVVLDNRQVGPGCFEMHLANEHVAGCAAPGQFVHVRVPTATADPLLRRPLSVCLAEPSGGVFTVLYQVVGKGTTMLSALRPGESLDVLGPLGRGFEMPPSGGSGGGRAGAGRAAVVAGGLGIAPLIMLSHALVRAKVGFSFIVGARASHLLVGLDLLPPHEDARLCQVHVVTEDGSVGRQGLVTDTLGDLLVRGDVTCVYACGPAGMLREVARLGEAFRVPVQVSLEQRMACGLGACLGCAVRARGTESGEHPAYLRVCADGPVFRAEEVDLDGIA